MSEGSHLKILSQPLITYSQSYNIDENLDVNQCVEMCLITQNFAYIDEILGNSDLFRQISSSNISKMI